MKAYDIISIASLWGLPGLTLDALREFSAFAHENHIRITADFTQDMASMGLDYILTTFVPMLKQAGVSREEILLMTQKNAQRALDF